MALGLAPQAADPPSLTVATSSLIAVLGLVAINGFFVAAEFSLVAARRSKLDEMVAKGDWGAKAGRRPAGQVRAHYSISTDTSLALSSASPSHRWRWAGSASRYWHTFLISSFAHSARIRRRRQPTLRPSRSRSSCSLFFTSCWVSLHRSRSLSPAPKRRRAPSPDR